MDTLGILNRASSLLKSMDREELIRRKEMAKLELSNNSNHFGQDGYFVFDLNGQFPEVTNAKARWLPKDMLNRRSVNVKSNNKSRNHAALSFCK
ncbi:MAG: hypothetical protein RLP14_08325 [Owenweeksia sp.]